jgi:hypothetical protein
MAYGFAFSKRTLAYPQSLLKKCWTRAYALGGARVRGAGMMNFLTFSVSLPAKLSEPIRRVILRGFEPSSKKAE